MKRTLKGSARTGRLPAFGAFGVFLAFGSAVVGLGCGPKDPIFVQAAPAPAAEPKARDSDSIPVRSPLQIAGDPQNGASQDTPPPRPTNACDIEPRILAMGRNCERLRGVSATGTGADRAAIAAFDGDLCTTWSAGRMAPQSATLDLGSPMLVSSIVLVPQMGTRRAVVRNVIEVSDDGNVFERFGELNLAMTPGELVELPIPKGVTTRFIRVVTLESPTEVAWRDIAILRCGRGR